MPSKQAWDALYSHDTVKNRASLSDNEYVVMARTDLEPLALMGADNNPIRTIVPPNETISSVVTAEGDRTAIWKTGHTAMRIMRYLAYSLKYAVPVFFVYAGKSLLFHEYRDQDLLSYYPPDLVAQTTVTQKGEKEWCAYLSNCFSEARKLLGCVEIGSQLDRAINAAGTAFSVDDPEFSYFAAWKAIEIIADKDFKESAGRFKEGIEDDESAYFSQIMGKLFSGKSFKLDTLDKVKTTLLRRTPFDNWKEVEKYYRLRNKIAHSVPDAADYQEIFSVLPALQNLSALVVNSAVEEKQEALDR